MNSALTGTVYVAAADPRQRVAADQSGNLWLLTPDGQDGILGFSPKNEVAKSLMLATYQNHHVQGVRWQ
jgi:hypothetical protein